MYCIQCGVKLTDTEAQCPLCGTKVCHPDAALGNGDRLYPPNSMPKRQRKSRLPQIVLTVAWFLPVLIVLLCDFQINRTVTWSGYVIGGLLLSYIVLVLPLWFRSPNPVIFVPCGFVAAGLYLLYINLVTDGDWFLSFAFPVTGGIGLIITAVVALLRYVRRGRLYVLGGAMIAMGAFMLLIEFLISLTFTVRFIGWSFYPLVALVLLGGFLIFLAICRPARETMERNFFF